MLERERRFQHTDAQEHGKAVMVCGTFRPNFDGRHDRSAHGRVRSQGKKR